MSQTGTEIHTTSCLMGPGCSYPGVKRSGREADYSPPSSKAKGKGKVVPVLLTKHHAMKAYWEVKVYLHSFFDLGTRWRWVVSFTPRPLYPQGKSPWYPLDRRLGGPRISDLGTRRRWVMCFTPRPLYPPGTHWIGGWVGTRAVLDTVVKRNISQPRRESNPRAPIVQPVA
jgi:hypothetical protein